MCMYPCVGLCICDYVYLSVTVYMYLYVHLCITVSSLPITISQETVALLSA